MDEAFRARYFDGVRPGAREVACSLDEASGVLVVTDAEAGERLAEAPAGRVRLLFSSAPGSPDKALFPDGTYAEVEGEALRRLAAGTPQAGRYRLSRFFSFLERNRGAALAMAAIFAALVAVFFLAILPAVSKWAAHRAPVSVAERIGSEALSMLEGRFFRESTLSAERREAIEAGFERLLGGHDTEFRYRLRFWRSRALGANAFALPSGDIVLLDGLVKAAEHDEEILGVLAHEIGHVELRHGLQSLLNRSAIAAFLTLATGDFGSLAGAAAALPALLVESGYARRFEAEADAFARELMLARGMDPGRLAALLRRLSGGEGGLAVRYLSTHPPTPERVEALEGVKGSASGEP